VPNEFAALNLSSLTDSERHKLLETDRVGFVMEVGKVADAGSVPFVTIISRPVITSSESSDASTFGRIELGAVVCDAVAMEGLGVERSAVTLTNSGQIHDKRKEYNEALDIYQEALCIRRDAY